MRLIRSKRPVNIALAAASAALCALALLAPAWAQSGGQARITTPDTAQFPAVTFFLEAYDSAGGFIPDLTADALAVLENDQPRPVTEILRVQPGVQTIIVYNGAPLMANRVGGETLFQKLQARLQSWAEEQPDQTNDDFSFVTGDGVQTIRQTEPRRWAQEIREYEPDLLHSSPSLAGFSQALDLTTDPNPRAQMKRAILYITPLPPDSALEALPNLAERAAQSEVRVFVWLVGTPANDATPVAEALRALAKDTGGHYFLFTGPENLPNPETYFAPLREVYQVSYLSGVRKAGSQRLRVRIERTGVSAASPEQRFSLNVQPPNPMFIEPPARIERGEGTDAVTLSMLVEYPDGFARPVKRAALYVDGSLVDEHTEQPFDRFTWDISGYQASGSHTLQIEVEDTLGFIQSSSETPVEVMVAQPAQITLRQRISPRRLLIGGAVFLAAGALVMVLWLSGKRGWFSAAERLRRDRRLKDPVTQPVEIAQEQPRGSPAGKDSPSWPRPAAQRTSPAWLVRLNDDNQPVTGDTIPILRRETTFGSSPQQASCVIQSPSISGLHARLSLTSDGSYQLADTGSVAGTWVNFSPVSSSGVTLQHGDIIHLGQIGFRFELANPGHERAPQLSQWEEPR